MSLLLGFAPFLAFALISNFGHPLEGLLAGALVSAGMMLRDWLQRRRRPRLLELGTFALFAVLSVVGYATHASWSVIGVRVCVDAGLLLIVLGSMAARQPFTLQYAREHVPEARWNDPAFVRSSYVMTAAWACAFAVIVAADLVLWLVPGFPHRLGVLVIVGALLGAMKFCQWYPHRHASPSAR